MTRLAASALLAATLAAACTSTDTNKAAQEATKSVKSFATSAPVLAAKDALLAIAVKARLAASDLDSTTGVGVTAKDGIVTLGGSVRTRPEIATVTAAARSVSGVKAVRTELHVDPYLPSAREQTGDLALEARVMAGIAAQAGLNALSVHASAKNGVVTLDGTVHTRPVEDTILNAATRTPGVRVLINHLRIAP